MDKEQLQKQIKVHEENGHEFSCTCCHGATCPTHDEGKLECRVYGKSDDELSEECRVRYKIYASSVWEFDSLVEVLQSHGLQVPVQNRHRLQLAAELSTSEAEQLRSLSFKVERDYQYAYCDSTGGAVTYVELPFESIFWRIHARHLPERSQKEKQPIVQLEWGWTAGLSEEDLSNIAEDAPTGKSSVVTNLEFIKLLRDDLNQLIESLEKQ
jgi:hypothetical protein